MKTDERKCERKGKEEKIETKKERKGKEEEKAFTAF